MRVHRIFLLAAALILALQAAAVGETGFGRTDVLTVSGSINPGVSELIKGGIETASIDGAACLVIELDTPGGLSESMHEIVQDLLNARIPVIVYVYPSGARVASAGVMITMAADIAAMAPGTNIGAAHPVGAAGRDIGETMNEKVVNDMVAQARSVAEKRGRNADWVEQAIRKSVSITETEALKQNVIDVVARDLPDLIAQINGRSVGEKGTLRLDPHRVKYLKEGLRTKVLRAIGDPNIAYILMMIGLAGLYFELAHPGGVFPGVVGAISLVLSFFAFQTLPVNYTGMLLILLALVFFFLELKVTSYGLLTVAGVVAMLLGSMMLFKTGDSGVHLSLQVMLTTVGTVTVFFVVLAALVVKAHTVRPRTGVEGLIGEVGVVKKSLTPEGKVFVHGELWRAVSSTPLDVGVRVGVVGVRGLLLEVEAVDATAEDDG